MLENKSFTLIELLVVIVILGILVALAYPNYNVIKEKALDREAKASLALMRAAERIYKMEIGYYYPQSGSTGNASLINANLKLSLPTSASKWTYSVDNSSATGTTQATRSEGAWIRGWTLDSSGPSEIPACSGSCL